MQNEHSDAKYLKEAEQLEETPNNHKETFSFNGFDPT